MASIEQIIKDLEAIMHSGGTGGGSSGASCRSQEKRRQNHKELLQTAKEFTKVDMRRIDLEIKALNY